MRVISGDARGIGPSAARAFLSALTIPYSAGCKAKEATYRVGLVHQQRVAATVVSIGNITTGGTGKTPATIYFARKYLEEGRNPVVLSRGYGRLSPMNEPLAVSDRKNFLVSPRESGDEPYLIAKKAEGVPVVVCGKRVRGARYAIENFGADIILLDDGFQHIAIARDEDIVVIDCHNPFGYGRLLPRGLLREPLHALGRATSFLLTHADECEHREILNTLRELNPTATVLKSRHRPLRLLSLEGNDGASCDLVANKNVLAVSSIGNPKAFEDALVGLGARVVKSLRFRDHHWYDASDIEEIERSAREAGAEYILSTEKDGVRLLCAPRAPEHVFLLEVELQLLG